MSKATEGKLPSGAHASKARSNYPGQETETRADGLQNRLKEKVREVKYDQKALQRARKARYALTGEPAVTPSFKDLPLKK